MGPGVRDLLRPIWVLPVRRRTGSVSDRERVEEGEKRSGDRYEEGRRRETDPRRETGLTVRDRKSLAFFRKVRGEFPTEEYPRTDRRGVWMVRLDLSTGGGDMEEP